MTAELPGGGLVYANGAGRLEFATLANGDVHAGSAGSGGSGATHGVDGTPGQAAGAAFLGDQTDFGFVDYVALSTAVVGSSSTPLCAGLAAAGGSINLAERELPGKRAGNPGTSVSSVRFGQPLPAYMPVYHGKADDAAASCNDLTLEPVTADQHDTPRPAGRRLRHRRARADYIFVDGFDGA